MANTGCYECILKMGNNQTNNIKQLSFIRVPLQKYASFVMCKVDLSPIHAKGLQTKASTNSFVEAIIEIWQVDRETKKKTKPVITKKYLIISISPDNGENFDLKRPEQSMILIMSNPVLYEMSIRNQYNLKHNNMTCLDAIKQYESKIKEYYGDNFNINRVGENTKVNGFKYEEQLIKAPSDLHVPRMLSSMYKCYNSYNLFFFDCFHLNKNANKDISIHHLNFFDPSDFKRVDITRFDDIVKFTIPGNETPFVDIHSDYNFTTPPNITYITSNNQFISEKTQTGQAKQYNSQGGKTQELGGGRSYSVNRPSSSQYVEIKRGTQAITIEVPETDIKNAKERVSNLKDTKIESIKEFTFQNCMSDFPNFGEIYNLEIDNKAEYLYTPIAISNNFIRESATDPYCKHYAKSNMVKYKSKTIA